MFYCMLCFTCDRSFNGGIKAKVHRSTQWDFAFILSATASFTPNERTDALCCVAEIIIYQTVECMATCSFRALATVVRR